MRERKKKKKKKKRLMVRDKDNARTHIPCSNDHTSVGVVGRSVAIQ